MRVGTVFQVGVCKNCGADIENTYWGNGGNLWTHIETGASDCNPRNPTAVPVGSSVKDVP